MLHGQVKNNMEYCRKRQIVLTIEMIDLGFQEADLSRAGSPFLEVGSYWLMAQLALHTCPSSLRSEICILGCSSFTSHQICYSGLCPPSTSWRGGCNVHCRTLIGPVGTLFNKAWGLLQKLNILGPSVSVKPPGFPGDLLPSIKTAAGRPWQHPVLNYLRSLCSPLLVAPVNCQGSLACRRHPSVLHSLMPLRPRHTTARVCVTPLPKITIFSVLLFCWRTCSSVSVSRLLAFEPISPWCRP